MKLTDVMHLEYARSKKWQFIFLSFIVLIQAIAIFCIFFETGRIPKVLSFIAALAQLGLIYSRYECRTRYDSAEAIRRLALLEHGIGLEISGEELAKIHARVGNPEAASPSYAGEYFSAAGAATVKKLFSDVRESAFFTGENATTTAKLFIFCSLAGCLASVALLIACIQGGLSPSNLEVISRAVVAGLAFCAAGEFVSLGADFYGLAATCRTIVDATPSSSEDSIRIAMDYNCATIQAPPIPEIIYRWNRDRLNKAWAHVR